MTLKILCLLFQCPTFELKACEITVNPLWGLTFLYKTFFLEIPPRYEKLKLYQNTDKQKNSRQKYSMKP